MVFDHTNATHLATLRERLSIERLAPYDAAAGGSLTRSLALYEWNTQIAAAFYASLQGLEVVLRNALDRELAAWHARRGYPGRWYDDPANVLDERRHRNIEEAKARIRFGGYRLDADRVVSELTFGFWRHLFDAHYEQRLWIPALKNAFPGLQPQRRSVIERRVSHLHRLRNRIAHHEPIHRRDLAADYRDLLFVASMICPQTSSWIGRTSTVPEVLAQRPR